MPEGLQANERSLIEAASTPDAVPAPGLVLQPRDLRSIDLAFS